MKSILRAALLLLVMTVLAGAIYPLAVMAFGQLVWPHESNGSLIKQGNKIVGSELIAQQFKSPKYFWPRPSASEFNAVPSGASNLGPTSKDLRKKIADRRSESAKANHVEKDDVPMDLLTTSASGLDPHITPAAARIQVKRIASARNLGEKGIDTIDKLIDDHVEKEQLQILGEQRVNVLKLNLDLDRCCNAKD